MCPSLKRSSYGNKFLVYVAYALHKKVYLKHATRVKKTLECQISRYNTLTIMNPDLILIQQKQLVIMNDNDADLIKSIPGVYIDYL